MSPTTRDFTNHLKEVREALKERWAEGEKMGDEAQMVAAVYSDIIDLNYDDDVAPFYDAIEEEETETND